METFGQNSTIWQPPIELQTTPREVRLTRAGKTAVFAIAVLALGAVFLTAWITHKAQVDARRWQAWQAEAVSAQGRVTYLYQRSSGKSRAYVVEYDYRVGELTYGGSSRINDREWKWLRQGDRIQVFYRRSEPGQSWISGHEPKGVPSWVGLLTSVGPLLPVLLFAAGMSRQRRLLEQGWPVQARVTKVVRSQQRGSAYRIEYAFQTTSGEEVKGRTLTNADVPGEGSDITVLYLPDRPKTSAPYPLPLVTVANL